MERDEESQVKMPDKLTARIIGCYDEEMFKAIQLLRESGYRVSSTPVSGISVELNYGSKTYSGLAEIEKFVKKY